MSKRGSKVPSIEEVSGSTVIKSPVEKSVLSRRRHTFSSETWGKEVKMDSYNLL